MQQEQPKYFKAVPVNEKPKKDGAYLMIFADGLFSNISYYYKEGQWAHPPHLRGYTHYLEPIQLPDAERLRDALEKIERISVKTDDHTHLDTIWNIAREVLSQTGDGWIRVEDGLPEHNVGVLVYIPMEDDHITSGMWDIDNKWVLLDEYRVVGEGEGMEECEVTHWMPMPSKPLNK